MKRLSLIALVAVMAASAAFAHQANYFMPQIPNPDNMVVDGNDDDWGWIDPAFAINPDTMLPTPSTFNAPCTALKSTGRSSAP